MLGLFTNVKMILTQTIHRSVGEPAEGSFPRDPNPNIPQNVTCYVAPPRARNKYVRTTYITLHNPTTSKNQHLLDTPEGVPQIKVNEI